MDSAEDPAKNLDLALHDADDKYRDAREKVVGALATKKRLERSIRAASEQIVRKRAAGGSQSRSQEQMRKSMERVIAGGATFPVIGSYDEVAEKFFRISQAGLDGMAVILVNYVKEMPVLRDEVLPRLERLQIREARRN